MTIAFSRTGYIKEGVEIMTTIEDLRRTVTLSQKTQKQLEVLRYLENNEDHLPKRILAAYHMYKNEMESAIDLLTTQH